MTISGKRKRSQMEGDNVPEDRSSAAAGGDDDDSASADGSDTDLDNEDLADEGEIEPSSDALKLDVSFNLRSPILLDYLLDVPPRNLQLRRYPCTFFTAIGLRSEANTH